MSRYNDIDMKRWKDYDDLITDSLWIIDKRDNQGTHKGDYHGNFIPQIPYQMMKRYTKKDEWILDPFVGSGTTLIEAQKLSRNAIGVDIDSNALRIAKSRLRPSDVTTKLVQGDSSSLEFNKILKSVGVSKVEFIIYHPPYWDIIKFNNIEGNIALADSLNDFLKRFEKVLNNTINLLEKNRYFCVVIGDIYKQGEWIPLNSYITQMILSKGYTLKSVIVKNVGETKAKSNQKALWRYRALMNGFYVFAHEYILLFQNKK